MDNIPVAKPSQFSTFIKLYIQTTYQLNQKFISPNSFQYLVLFCSMLQPFYFLQRVTAKDNQIYTLMQSLIRPDIMLIDFSYLGNKEYLILLIAQAFQKISFLALCYVNKNHETFFQQEILSKSGQYVIQILIYYQQYLGVYLILPITSIFITKIYQSIENQGFLDMFLCCLGLLLYLFDNLYFFKIFTHPISYRIEKCKKFAISNIDYAILKLNLIQLGMAQYKSSDLGQIQAVFLLLTSLLQIYHQIQNCSYIYHLQKQIFFICNSFLILSSIESLFESLHQEDFRFAFYIILPLAVNIFRIYQEQQDNRYYKLMFLKKIHQTSENNIYQSLYQLVRILNNCDTQKNYLNFKQSLVYCHHVQKCQKPKCSCRLDLYITESSQINATTVIMVNKFMKKQYKQLINQLLQFKIKKSQLKDLLISIAILLYDFNQTMVSLQILSQLRATNTTSVVNLTFLQVFLNQKHGKENEEKKIKVILSYIQKVQIKLVLVQARSKFETNLGTSLSAAKQTLTKQFLTDFLKNETTISEIVEEMKLCTKMKILFYEMLESDSGYKTNQLFKKIKETNNCLIKLEETIQHLFTKAPNLQVQNLFCFFEAQIMNNLLAAFKIRSSDIIFRENQIKYRSIKELNLQAEINSYQIISISENFSTLNIEFASHNFSKLFGGQFDITQHRFLDIIPPYYAKFHEYSVQAFFHSGKNKFYRNLSSTFIMTHNGLLRQINLCIDNTQIFKHEKFIFATFMQSKDNDTSSVVVDASTQLVFFTYQALKQFGINDVQQKQMLEDNILYQVGVLTIVPYFNHLIKTDTIQAINTTCCFFLKPGYCNAQTMTSLSVRNNPNYFIWRNKENINCFSCEFKIEKIVLEYGSYFTLEFLQIKPITIDSDRRKMLELYQPCLGDGSLNKSSKWKGKSLKIMSILSFRTERRKTTQKQDQNQGQQNNQKLNQSSFIQNLNQSQSNLLSSRNRNEQEFFKNFNKSFVESEIQISQQGKVEEQIPEQRNQQLPETQHQKISQQEERHIPYQQSSSVAGVYRPFFYNRYSLLEKMSRKKNPKRIDFFLFFFIGQSLIFLIFSILVMGNMTKDMSTIINDIQMESLHSNIMGPHDLFFQMRVTISSYQQMQREGFFTQNQTQLLVEPYYQNIHYGFQELRESYFNLFKKDSLQQFFDDLHVDLRIMNQNSSQLELFATSFRESLYIVLQYQFEAVRIIEQRGSTSGTPFQIFLIANYFLLHDDSENLTLEIKEWLIWQNEFIAQKGLVFWIILQSILILFCFTGMYNFNSYMKYYDQFLLVFSEFNKQLIFSQLNKYDHIFQLLHQDQDDLTKYNFDQEMHEDKPNTQKGKPSIHHFKLLNRNQQKLSRFTVFSIIITITGIYLIYTSMIFYKQKTFQSRYEDTINLYKLIQDLKLKSGCIYLFKELFLRWNNYTFLTNNEKLILQSYIEASHKLMSEYILLSSTYESSLYLISDSFSNKFISTQHNSVCDEVQQNLFDFMFQYCEKSFQGTLEQGLIESLNFMSNDIRIQEAVNNFTKRVEVQLYEQEGAQIITRAFFLLSDLFEKSLQEVCYNMNQFLILFSLSYVLLSTLLIILTQTQYRKYLINEYHQARMSLYLIPKESILYDESLERYLREIALHQGLI